MRIGWQGPALLAAAAISSAALAQPAARAPQRNWVVQFEDDQCLASRQYGTAAQPLQLVLKPSPMGRTMRLMLIGRGAPPADGSAPATLRLGSGTPLAAEMLTYADSAPGTTVRSMTLPAASVASLRSARSLEIQGGNVHERLALSGMGQLVATLERCAQDLRNVWNVGAPYEARIARPAAPVDGISRLIEAVANADLIPVGKLANNQVVALIDERGKVRDCMVEEQSGIAALDAASCEMLRTQAVFTPAVGAGGKPVKSAYVKRISWGG